MTIQFLPSFLNMGRLMEKIPQLFIMYCIGHISYNHVTVASSLPHILVGKYLKTWNVLEKRPK